MVLMKNTSCVVLVFLCAAWLSTAQLNPKGAAVNDLPDIKETISTSVTKSSTTTVMKSMDAIDEELGSLNKARSKLFAPNVEAKRNARRSYLSDEVAFTADYRRPVHHPPKNNK